MKLFVLFILAFGSKQRETVTKHGTTPGEDGKINAEKPIVVKIEEEEFVKRNKRGYSEYIGVSYYKKEAKWGAQRKSKNEKKMIQNGWYDSEEEAAHASDTLGRKLIENGEHGHKLNFPYDDTELYKKRTSSGYIGVTCYKRTKWQTQRYSKNENKMIYYGYYETVEKAAHASDTLARKLIKNGEQGHKLNFPEDETEVHKKRGSSKYIGVTYYKKEAKWRAQRHSKQNENKMVSNGYYDDEESAAHASDTLAKQLMKNGEHGHKLNFTDHETEHKKKRKRSNNLENLQEI